MLVVVRHSLTHRLTPRAGELMQRTIIVDDPHGGRGSTAQGSAQLRVLEANCVSVGV